MRSLSMRHPALTGGLAVLSIVTAFLFGAGTTVPAVMLQDDELPITKLYPLNEGDTLTYMLPNGRKLIWGAAKDEFGIGEQTTVCGLKAHLSQPSFRALQQQRVVTSSGPKVSIYSFTIDGYQVERAEDLAASSCLPVIIRVCKADKATDLDHAEARDLFDKQAAPASTQPLRVPIGTVHHLLNEQVSFPVRLLAIDGDVCFQVSGNLAASTEAERRKVLAKMMDIVVERYDRIDRIRQFSLEVMEKDTATHRYQVRKNDTGQWSIHKVAP